jgi:aminoglycoside/choline kinase family phosphotransferase
MTLPSRAAERLAWTRSALDDPQAQLESASADASFRSYWRSHSGGATWIVMDAPPDKEDIRPWLDIAQRLNAGGLHAPRIRANDAELGFVLMADLGTRLYLPALNEDSVDALYSDALDALFTMQTQVDAADLPAYDAARLNAEMELLPTWFLTRHLGFAIEPDDQAVIAAAFSALADAAGQQPQVFVHRDYHSRNLLITNRDNPGILDFQDAVRGPATYDLVSLLRDCYIAWPEQRVVAWAESYRQRLVGAGLIDADSATFQRYFDLMGLQRHIKVLGIFCRLWYRDGKAGYLNDLPMVWKYTREIGQRHAETAALIALIERALSERDITLPLA